MVTSGERSTNYDFPIFGSYLMQRAAFLAAMLTLILGVAVYRAAAQNQSNAPSPQAAPKAPPGAAPAASPDVLSQLDPAPTMAELELYKQTKTKSPGDIPKFLATRKYLRQIWAAFPDGKLDPDKAPAPSADVDFGLCLTFNEQMILMPIEISAGSKGGAK